MVIQLLETVVIIYAQLKLIGNVLMSSFLYQFAPRFVRMARTLFQQNVMLVQQMDAFLIVQGFILAMTVQEEMLLTPWFVLINALIQLLQLFQADISVIKDNVLHFVEMDRYRQLKHVMTDHGMKMVAKRTVME